jgi:hypothetical protein
LLVSFDKWFQSACDERFELCVSATAIDGQEQQNCSDIFVTPDLVYRTSVYRTSAHTFVRFRSPATSRVFISKEVSVQAGNVVDVVLSAP